MSPRATLIRMVQWRFAVSAMDKWFNIINGTGVHLWLNGDTHGENHDYSSSLGVHFVDNGAGIQKESASGIPTYAADYDWLKLQYHTANDKWSYAKTFNATTIGVVTTKHCWYAPNDGAEGKECASSSGSS
ncbi:hypothetical protein PHYPSEUDO_000292 [Phytophthora pseudosyringae]|uniref:Uncharacterized protein n=1 Tax=Phytophthora pseudosyringae TaxID=221518 RepID=A0A8T1V406_9STRA|nr:hypothetical protein PHYPSEUDO_000292 [Phytophthora pseudosyringae]